MKIIFICHNNESIQFVYDKVKRNDDMYIILVGDKSINDEYLIDEKIIIARNYTNHIEQEKKLLTFTAWYLIIHNQLFIDEDYLCLLEYDVSFDDDFLNKLKESYHKYDIVSFQQTEESFESDIDKNKLTSYLSQHSLQSLKLWWPTTNHCFRRDLLAEFVNFYFYTYKDIEDDNNLPFYHERIFSSYTSSMNRLLIAGLQHHGIYSHHEFTSKKYILCYENDNVLKTDELITSINIFSNDTEVIRCNKNDIGPTELWKPIIIYEILKSIDGRATLMYVDNNYKFSSNFDYLYKDFTFIKSWNLNQKINVTPIIELYNLQQYNITEVELLNTNIIIFENKPEVIHIVKQWLDMCIHFSNQSLSKNIPNYIDVMFSLLIQIYSKTIHKK
jgi:hypothetical protein